MQEEQGKLLKILSTGNDVIKFKFPKDHSDCNVGNILEENECGFRRAALVLVRDIINLDWSGNDGNEKDT